MESHLNNINSFWGYLLIEELVRNDVTCFCISPGSRSTPLTIAAAENNQAEKIICFDERAAAFYAIGYARAKGKPAAVICTSGTAAANLYPAITEAKNSQISLILITADRPPELRDTGANQTIRQVGMYGDFLNWQFDLPCPDEKIPAKFVLSTIDQAVHQAIEKPCGPVHLNCMFREPLEPSPQEFPVAYRASIDRWENSSKVLTEYIPSIRTVDNQSMDEMTGLINGSENGLLVIGQLHRDTERRAVIKLARHLQWPVFADITSGIRHDRKDIINIAYFDHILLSDQVIETLQPDMILHFGRPLTSKRYLNLIEVITAENYFHFDSGDSRLDPAHVIRKRFSADLGAICQHIETKTKPRMKTAKEKNLIEINKKTEDIIDTFYSSEKKITEITLPRLISKELPRDQGLFLASSMPIRDFDMYAGSYIKTSDIAANRGVSGIDGTLATAVGFAKGLKKRVTVVIGDLAMIHDLNSLSLIHDSHFPLTIVVVNNSGGGIFSFLPVSEYKHVFDKFFATPHPYQFEHAAKMFNIAYVKPQTIDAFLDSYKQSLSQRTSTLIEIITEREQNYKRHQEIQSKIKSTLAK
jgi:2-succinyl-5-enolpyruvyl-6-hydroxy-3-cyclohexene-1-carboxylate synthase